METVGSHTHVQSQEELSWQGTYMYISNGLAHISAVIIKANYRDTVLSFLSMSHHN